MILTQPMTNADRIRSMTDAELADFLYDIECAVDTPWNFAFSKAFCDSCGEFTCPEDTECPYGRPVDFWLTQMVETHD